jgi:hypothetical protein
MRGRQRRLGLTIRATLAASVMLLLVAAPVNAQGPPLQGSGTGQLTRLEITPLRDAGGNLHEERVITGTVDGALTGTFEQRVTGTVHTNHPDTRVTFRGVLVFTGTIAGCGDAEHTITLGLAGRGDVPVAGFPITEASVRAIPGPADTLKVTGQGTVSQTGPALTYEVHYICH